MIAPDHDEPKKREERAAHWLCHGHGGHVPPLLEIATGEMCIKISTEVVGYFRTLNS